MSIQIMKEIANTVRLRRKQKIKNIKTASLMLASLVVVFSAQLVIWSFTESIALGATLTITLFATTVVTYRVFAYSRHNRTCSQGTDIAQELAKNHAQPSVQEIALVEQIIKIQEHPPACTVKTPPATQLATEEPFLRLPVYLL